MAVNQRLELRQGQSLVMTPQLQQAIKLLQMSNIELQAFVETELERNPLLERDERSEDPVKPEVAERPEARADMVHELAAGGATATGVGGSTAGSGATGPATSGPAPSVGANS